MRKAITLRVDLWIEGEEEPAHNFAESTKRAVSDIIGAGISQHPELIVTIQNVSERDGEDDPAG